MRLPLSTLVLLLVAPAGLPFSGVPLAAQSPGDAPVVQEVPPVAVQQEEERLPVTPGGAFLRGLIIPGWGHAATGSYTRGGFYFLAEAGAAWMLFRTASTRGSARRIRDLKEETVEFRLRAEGVSDPDSLRLLVGQDQGVQDAQALVDSRSQQFEDWAALGIFLILISAADAFVAGHLQDFPAPLSIRAAPPGTFGSRPHDEDAGSQGAIGRFGPLEVQLSIPWDGPWSGGRRSR